MLLIGVDPGLVHTGVVRLDFRPSGLVVEHEVFAGDNPQGVAQYVLHRPTPHVWIEAYTDRASAYGGDEKMRRLMAELKVLLPKAHVLDNMGVKQVVQRHLMEKLNCWRFGTPTHHQDLRSAARIAIYGALKDPVLNEKLFDYVTRELDR